jgi:hypothetical protein
MPNMMCTMTGMPKKMCAMAGMPKNDFRDKWYASPV